MIEKLNYNAEYYVKKTVAWALAPSRDEKTITKNVRYMYGESKLNPQVRVIVCTSLGKFSKERANVQNNVRTNVQTNVQTNVRANVQNNVQNNVRANVHANVQNNVRANVRANVEANVWDNVWDNVRDKVRANVWDNVHANVHANVNANVWDNVEANYWADYWADDIAFNDVFISEGIVTDKKLIEAFGKWKDCIADISMSFLTNEVAVILTKPKVRQDTSNFLHSDEFPALEWSDTGFYYLHGVKFPKELWEKVVSRNMPFEKILAIDDIDQRTQAMKYGDIDKFLEFVSARTVDTYTKRTLEGKDIHYKLVEIPKGIVFTKSVYFAIYDCPSTDKKYMSGVPEFKTVPEAMAWKQSNDLYQVTPEDWINSIPLVNES